MLQPDPQDQNLQALKAILAAINNQSHPVQHISNTFQPSASAVRVNVLWFSSLALTLGVAVQVMLAKQWIHKYGEGKPILRPLACLTHGKDSQMCQGCECNCVSIVTTTFDVGHYRKW